ncbi:MAG: YifB family Mg chelatase-like AAA ATPase [Planctomycetes bacterium]|nr:YifB family Mg chelatase-like AAA ATPase [Planctomycetota bacterium]
MLARVTSFVLRGIDAVACEVEADLHAAGLPKTTIVGLPDAAVRESIERVRTALRNRGYRYPRGRLTVNLAPANLRKEGPVYDLPIALSVLQADSTIAPPDDGCPRLDELLVAGELALDGRVRGVRGAISLALLARKLGRRGVVVPAVNAAEAAAVDGVRVYPAASIEELVGFLNGVHPIEPHPPVDTEAMVHATTPEVDFADVRGQEAAKRAITIAAAGGHNMLMLGPAGTGKTMMARALPGVLPPLSRDEALEVTRIYSCAGCLPPDQPLVMRRPVRMPHHTASGPAIVGGGSIPRPGEVSLAHRGVLFLDEVPEFSRSVLETLRQPLEDGTVTVARTRGTVRFPARFMLVGAMNPTARGDMSDDAASHRAMDRYVDRVSGPLVDRIDLHVEVPAVPFRELSSLQRGTDTATIRERVRMARDQQRHRQGRLVNAELPGSALDRWARLDDASRMLLEQAMTELGLSARAYDKVRRIARTIADLQRVDGIAAHHVAESIQYRLLDRRRRAAAVR